MFSLPNPCRVMVQSRQRRSVGRQNPRFLLPYLLVETLVISPMVNLVGSDISLGKRLGFFLRLLATCRLTPYLNSNSSKLQIYGFYKGEGVVGHLSLEFCTDSLQWSSWRTKSLSSKVLGF